MAALRERSMLVEPASESAPDPAATAVSARLQPEEAVASPSGGRADGQAPPPPPAAPGPAVPTPSAAAGPSAPSQPQLQLSVPWSTVQGQLNNICNRMYLIRVCLVVTWYGSVGSGT